MASTIWRIPIEQCNCFFFPFFISVKCLFDVLFLIMPKNYVVIAQDPFLYVLFLQIPLAKGVRTVAVGTSKSPLLL